jgi:hypothetical protein
VHFHANDTAHLEGVWLYDIKIKAVDGKFLRAARGTIEFLPNLTQATE